MQQAYSWWWLQIRSIQKKALKNHLMMQGTNDKDRQGFSFV